MEKNIKLIIVVTALIIISATVFLYLNTQELTLNDQAGQFSRKVDIAELERNYKKDMAAIYKDISLLIDSGKMEEENVDQLRDRLLAMRVPKEYKDLHIGMVLALDKIDKYAEQGSGDSKAEGEKMIEELNQKYNWINN